MIYKFTKRAEKALDEANKVAVKLGHNYIGTEHLLYGLVKEGAGIACKVLENQGVTPEKILEEIEVLIGVNENGLDVMGNSVGFTPRTKRVIENSFREAKKQGNDYIGTEHLLIGIMREGDSVAVRIMLDLNVDPQKLYNEIVKVLNDDETLLGNSKTVSHKSNNSYNQTTTLNQFGSDLTKQAEDRKVRPCYR